VIFLPNESLFYAAMEADGELLAFAEEQRVILATPLSLIAFLRVVAHGWTQATLSRNALEIREVAQTLNSRVCALLDDVADVGAGLESAVRSFNRVVGRRRNMDASFRRLSELGVGDGGQGATIEEIDHELRSFLPSKEPRAGTLPLYVAASEAKD
jgi:DNA recombination protein RmuC